METVSSFEKYFIPFGESFPVNFQQLTGLPHLLCQAPGLSGLQQVTSKIHGFFFRRNWEFSPTNLTIKIRQSHLFGTN